MSKKIYEFSIPCNEYKIGNIRLTDSIFDQDKANNEDFVNSTFEKSYPPHYLLTISTFINLINGNSQEIRQKHLVSQLSARLLILNKFEICFANPSCQVIENSNNE